MDQQQSERVLQDAVADAENALALFVQDSLDEVRREIEQDVVVQEIRQGRRFLPQFGVSVAGGVVSALIFAAILAIVAWFVFSDPSPVGLVRGNLTSPPGENSSGKADHE